MRELLLINNEPTPEDRGRIVRAGELGLTDPLYNIDALSAKLSEFGMVTVRHYTQLRTLDSAPDAIFLSGCFTDWDRERLRETFADELALIRETTAPLFGICEEFGFLPQTVLAQHPLLTSLSGTLHCFEHHRGQLSTVPEGFRLLVSRESCRVQLLTHGSRPIFGTQFHPELQNAAHRDGQRILENFFAHYVK